MSKSNKKKEEARLTKKGRSGTRQLLLQAQNQHQLNGDGFDELAVGDHFGQLGAVVFFNFPGFGKQVGILDF